jgi:hypothetical protein
MTIVRRLVLIISIVVTGSLALGAAATAAGTGTGGGKGGPLGPGEYRFTDTSAMAAFGTSSPTGGPPAVLINVDRNVSTFQPDEGQDSVTKATTVSLQVATPALSGFGCFTIDPSEFTVSEDMQTASLHTTLSAPCAGPKGGANTLPRGIQLDVTWAGNGVLGTSRHNDSFECADYQITSNFVAHAAGVAASGSVTLGSTSVSPQAPANAATLQSSQVRTHVIGVEKPACFAVQFSA